MVASAESVLALRGKYREIKRLRSEALAGFDAEPRADMLALAQRFPGALRELDQLPMPEIERRLAALDAVIERDASAPAWVALQISYHGTMRAALRIKRIAHRRTRADAEHVLAELRLDYVAAHDEPPLATLDLAALEAILEPVEGRLNPWVFARVAEQHGVTPDQVRLALFLR